MDARHTKTLEETQNTRRMNRLRTGEDRPSESDQAEAKEKAEKWEVPCPWRRSVRVQTAGRKRVWKSLLPEPCLPLREEQLNTDLSAQRARLQKARVTP